MTKELFENAVERNSQRLYLICMSYLHNHHDSEDVEQNAFLKLWKSEKEFDTDEYMDKWLTVVCVNECKNHLKSQSKHISLPLDEVQGLYTFDSAGDLDLFKAVMALPQKESAVIHLFYYEDMKVEEIADVLKIKESAVKQRLKRGREHIKKQLGDDWNEEQ